MGTRSTGKCTFCQQSFAKSGMTRHLAACAKRKEHLNDLPIGKSKIRNTTLMHLVVEGRPNPEYWLQIELPADSPLDHLDGFLRAIWLECCGHMSLFQIGGQNYTVMPDGDFGDKPMTGKLGKLLPTGAQAAYEYDFGTTSELLIRSVAERPAAYRGYDITILARNDAPVYPCVVCQQPAVSVCMLCVNEGSGFLCKAHAKKHECGEEMLLPVVNSPRTGMCAYTG